MRFRILFLTTTGLLAFYTVLCAVRLVPDYRVASGFISLAAIFFILRMQLFHRHKRHETKSCSALMWISSFGLSVWSSFILYCIMIDGLGLAMLIAQLAGAESLADIDRQYWIAGAIRLALIAAVITSFIGLLQAVTGPVIRRIKVPVATLPPELAGLKIVQLSDLHIGAIIHKDYIERVVHLTQSLAPDIIAVTGDLADGSPEALRPHTAPLASLKAPLGVYFVTGNHEYYSGAPGWIAEAEQLGMTPLINENRVVRHKQKMIMIAGVTDLTSHHFIPSHISDPHKAAQTNVACDLRLLLAHQPESCEAAEAAGFTLQFSGHTHAGQYFPFSLLVRLAKRYSRGLYHVKRLWLYVNPGTGFWGAANRFGIPAEITLLELTVAS